MLAVQIDFFLLLPLCRAITPWLKFWQGLIDYEYLINWNLKYVHIWLHIRMYKTKDCQSICRTMYVTTKYGRVIVIFSISKTLFMIKDNKMMMKNHLCIVCIQPS